MTNSNPKNSSRIERQGSPNSQGGKKSGQRSPNYIKTVTYFGSGANTGGANGTTNLAEKSATGGGGNGGRNSRSSPAGRQNCNSPNSPTRNNQRSSPNRHDSPRGSPTSNFYAGAKFSEPPSATCVPKPPSHWTGPMMGSCLSAAAINPFHLGQHLKMLINAQA